MKNVLYGKINDFASSTHSGKGEIFTMIMKVLSAELGAPSPSNAKEYYERLTNALRDLYDVLDTRKKIEGGLFPAEMDPEIKRGLDETSRNAISELREGRIDGSTLRAHARLLGQIEADKIYAAFSARLDMDAEAKRMGLGSGTDILDKLKEYAGTSERFKKWTSHDNMNIFGLMGSFLGLNTDEEIYRNILGALDAGNRRHFRRVEIRERRLQEDHRRDYSHTFRRNCRKRKRRSSTPTWKKPKATRFTKNYNKMEGYDGIKSSIEQVRGFEKDVAYDAGDGTTAKFTGDFYDLFTIGHSDRFGSCQNCTSTYGLNQGLTGYVSNGTNKAIALMDANGRVLARRIVRLRIVEEKVVEEGKEKIKRYPVIYVEENQQFNQPSDEGKAYVEKLYGILDMMAKRTGMSVAVAQVHPLAGSAKVAEGERREVWLDRFVGRSRYDYSDSYGSRMPGHVSAGLFKQTEDVTGMGTPDKPVGSHYLVFRPMLSPAEDRIAAANGLGERVGEEKPLEPLRPVRSPGAKITTFLEDMTIAELDRQATPGKVMETEKLPGVSVVKVRNPSDVQIKALMEKGYFLAPEHVIYRP